jgi:tetratricopeptide (TPR) repeat protein
MARIGKLLVVALLVAPVAAQAQKPGNTLQTRSASLYLDQAEKAQNPADKQKFLKHALDKALEGVTKNADNPKSWFTLGQVYAVQGDALGADSAFDKAETMWPDYVNESEEPRFRAFAMAFNEGVAAIQEKNNEEAIAKLEAANAVYGKRPAASLNLGSLYVSLNQLDKAGAAFEHALEILRGPERKTLNEAESKQWAQWEEAAAFNYAQILASTGKYDEAVKAYQDYLAGNPDNLTAKSSLAEVYVRMGKQEEASKVYQELLSGDLSDDDFFQVGVGLFRGNQYAQAADAFRKVIAKNPSSRDAHYNLAQAIHSQVQDLEDARAKAAAGETKTLDAQLKPMYEELQVVTEKARSFDPNNRTLLALLARGYRGMADVDVKAATDWKNRTLEVMKAHQALPIEITDIAMVVSEEGEAKITGKLANLNATEGQPIKLTFSFLGKDGKVLGTQDVTVTVPKAEGQADFNTSLKATEPVGGWKYEVN